MRRAEVKGEKLENSQPPTVPVVQASNIVEAWKNPSFGPRSKMIITEALEKAQAHVDLVQKKREEFGKQLVEVLKAAKLMISPTWFERNKSIYEEIDILFNKDISMRLPAVYESARRVKNMGLWRVLSRSASGKISKDLAREHLKLIKIAKGLYNVVEPGEFQDGIAEVIKYFQSLDRLPIKGTLSLKHVPTFVADSFETAIKEDLLSSLERFDTYHQRFNDNLLEALKAQKMRNEVGEKGQAAQGQSAVRKLSREYAALKKKDEHAFGKAKEVLVAASIFRFRTYQLASELTKLVNAIEAGESTHLNIPDTIAEYCEDYLKRAHQEIYGQVFRSYQSEIEQTPEKAKKPSELIVALAKATRGIGIEANGNFEDRQGRELESAVQAVAEILEEHQVTSYSQLRRAPVIVRKVAKIVFDRLDEIEKQNQAKIAKRNEEKELFTPDLLREGLSSETIDALFEKFETAENVLEQLEKIKAFIKDQFDLISAQHMTLAQELLLMDQTDLHTYEQKLSQMRRNVYKVYGAELHAGKFTMPEMIELLPSEIDETTRLLFNEESDKG